MRTAVALRRKREASNPTPRMIESLVRRRSRGAIEPAPAHWIHGANEIPGSATDDGDDWCRRCAEKKVHEILTANPERAEFVGLCVDGGWSTENDHLAYCVACGAKLDCDPTDHCVDTELEHFEIYAPDGAEDWDAIRRVIFTLGYLGFDTPIVELQETTDRFANRRVLAWKRLAAIARRTLGRWV